MSGQQRGGEGITGWQAKLSIADSYSEVAAGWRMLRPAFEQAGAAVTDLLLAAAAVAPGQRVLDLASGAGVPALAIAGLVGQGGLVLATDLSPAMLSVTQAEAMARCAGSLHCAVIDAEHLPFRSSSFDRVTCRFGIMHLPDAPRALTEARRVLRPGGRMALAALGDPWQTTAFTATFGVIHRHISLSFTTNGLPNPYRFAAPGALAALVRACGFVAVAEEQVLTAAPWPGSPQQFWANLPEHTPGFARLLTQLPTALAAQVKTESLALLHQVYDGDCLQFQAPAVLVSAEPPMGDAQGHPTEYDAPDHSVLSVPPAGAGGSPLRHASRANPARMPLP